MKRLGLSILLALGLCLGCASTERVDTDNDTEVTVSFDYRDIEGAVAQLVASLLESPRLAPQGDQLAVVAIGRVTNDTCQHLDTDLITLRLSEALMATDRFTLTSVFADKASGRDTMVSDARTARGNAEFNQSTTQKQGQLVAPDFSLTGKLSQRNVRRDDGGLRVEYFLTLKATRIRDGLTLWQSNVQRVKAVADGMPVW